ncbi:PLP-dependent aminotransferase family protein [Telluria beijingensis]|uniref:MocR-like pyridoxine biosynthesis transcription factor PdxR n=1 Tax=Telluria beijingensis TaxID=3068633 RepID=UPI0027956146|nr:PLP-dependent aminotransferase family protein [Massilia sp. REN29]
MDIQNLKPTRERDEPIYLQLYRRYCEAIAAGKLKAGDRVPSVRSLASELNLARGTVEAAYQMLVGEGYFVARGAAGTVVSPRLARLAEPAGPRTVPPRAPDANSPQGAPGQALPFQLGLPALDAFPRKTWARLAGHTLRTLAAAAMTYPDPAGHEPLRRSIATYLGISRGIDCAPEQVFVTAGYHGALELVRRVLLRDGDLGWYEDPGYALARRFLLRAGLRLAPVPVDAEGLDVAHGLRRAPDARFAVVTPTHQSPMGMAMSLPRRLELLEWARASRAWIVEDDYDSEFRYHGRPLPALKSLDRHGRVLYTGTFSKVLLPGLRLAYLVVPAAQVARMRELVDLLPGPGSILPQATVADFMEQGHFARHLRKMRALYAERRGWLVDALARELGDRISIQPQAGGIHVLARLAAGHDDRALAAAAQARGLGLKALGDWRVGRSSRGGLLMGFTNFGTPDVATAEVRRLRTIMDATWSA